MERFLIGMWERFDEAKFQRDYREGFYGIEACNMLPEEVETLKRRCAEEKIRFGVHYPLVKKERLCRDPLLLHPDKTIREAQWKELEAELQLSKDAGAAYLVLHAPKPMLVDRSMGLSCWRFGNAAEWLYTDLYDEKELDENFTRMFERLTDLLERFRIPIYIEHDLLSADARIADRLIMLSEAFPEIGLCLDFARLHLQSCTDSKFDAVSFIESAAPYVRHVHLANTSPMQNKQGGHFPALPELSPSDGWADIEAYFRALNSGGSEYTVLFEHRSDWITDKQLESCYSYTEKLLNVNNVDNMLINKD